MQDYPRFTEEKNINARVGCCYLYMYGANDSFYPHRHSYYEIFITVSGVVTHWVNGKEYELPEGSLVFIRPDDIHGYKYNNEKSRDTEYVNLAFSKEIANSVFEFLSPDFPTDTLFKSELPPTVVLNSAEKKRLLSQLSELNTLNWKSEKRFRLRLKTILADIFAHCFYNISDKTDAEIPQWFSQLLKEMNLPENFTNGISVMIEKSRKSREHLSRVTKKYLGVSLTEYINNLRVNYAANLLLNTNFRIIDICYMCGFQNLGYFYKIFKNQYNISPAMFAKRYRGEKK